MHCVFVCFNEMWKLRVCIRLYCNLTIVFEQVMDD